MDSKIIPNVKNLSEKLQKIFTFPTLLASHYTFPSGDYSTTFEGEIIPTSVATAPRFIY